MVKKQKNVFKKFNRYPYEHECRHSTELVESLRKAKTEDIASIHDEITLPPEDLDCTCLGERIEKFWLRHLDSRGPEKASLSYVLFRSLIWDFLSTFVWIIVIRIVLIITVLESLKDSLTLLDHFNELKQRTKAASDGPYGNVSHSQFDDVRIKLITDKELEHIYYDILIQISILFAALCTVNLFYSHLKLKFSRCGLKCRVAMIQMIQRKSLRLHLSTSIEQSSSRAVSLISNEVTFIEESNRYLLFIITGPGALVAVYTWLALTQIGWRPVIADLPPLFFFIAVNVYLPKIYKRISRRRKEETNKRIEIINTFLSSIKVVKMYAWERKFKDKIQELREKEQKQLKRLDMFQNCDLISMALSGKILMGVIVIVYIILHRTLDARILFTTTLAFNYFRLDGMFYFPKSIKCFFDLKEACSNLKKYLLLEEFEDGRQRIPTDISDNRRIRISCENLYVTLKTPSQKPVESKSINFKSLTANVIEGLNLNMNSGDLVLVLGQVGSGKSSFLLTLLGETRITSGLLSVSEGAHFAYASQEPCLFSDSLKNNILTGRPLDPIRYKRVIEVCSLERDISLLPEGDETLVGPKGVSLSGGQRARLNLARAVYSDADIYLLDDPLSAVDSKVARSIFDDCIRKFLSGKLVVLATHHTQLVEQSSKIVLLESGRRPVCGPTEKVILSQEYKLIAENFNRMNSNKEIDDHMEVDRSKNLFKKDKPKEETTKESCRYLSNKQATNESSIYLFFMKIGLSKVDAVFLATSALLMTITGVSSEYYFRIWSAEVKRDQNSGRPSSFHKMVEYWVVFMAIVFISSMVSSIFQILIMKGMRKAADSLHNRLIDSLFRAKMSFYDFCQTGELASRYAGDFAIIDHGLMQNMVFVSTLGSLMIGSVMAVSIIKPTQALPYICMALVAYPIASSKIWRLRLMINSSKQLRAPVYSLLSSSIDDLNTVRSENDHLACAKRKFDLSHNKLTAMSLLSMSYEAQTTTIIKTVSCSVTGIVLYFVFVVYWGEMDVSSTGTVLLLVINAISMYPALMEYFALMESSIMSVKSVRTFTELEPEADFQREEFDTVGETKAKPERTIEWRVGQVSFRDVSLRYFEDEPYVLHKLSFDIRGGERIGIVGRTGAGKSSIVSVLYRLYQFEGVVSIDGVDTKSLLLAELRSSLGVIPQEPVLICDTLRKNLDLFDVYSDDELWRALEVVNLREYVAQNLHSGLDHVVSESGRNLSVGQRQLVCLARAVLRSPKVMLIDEATANVDRETDAFIQRTIRSQFMGSTIITIAHKLNTIMDYDRVMVLDAGKMVEFDTVDRLLAKKNGVFKSMLESSSDNG